MESFIGTMGGLAILLIPGISVAFVAIVIFKLGKSPKQPGCKGIKNCLICGSPTEAVAGSPHIIRCTNPQCPNNAIT